MIWPFFHHYLALREIFPELQLPKAAALDNWIESMRALPAVLKIIDVAAYAAFLDLYMTGKYEFDFGL